MTVTSVRSKWKPQTRLGWYAVWLMILYVMMYILVIAVMALRLSLPPIFGPIWLLGGLGASVIGLVAIVKQHERAWIVWLTLLPGLFALILVLGEFLGTPH